MIDVAVLVERSRAGDRAAFCELVALFLEPLATLIRYRTDPRVKEDLLQEVLLLAWININQIRDPRRFRAWIFQIATNECRCHHRRRALREIPAGRTVYWRRYNGRLWRVDPQASGEKSTPWDERLSDQARIVVDGCTFVHWYDCLTQSSFTDGTPL